MKRLTYILVIFCFLGPNIIITISLPNILIEAVSFSEEKYMFYVHKKLDTKPKRRTYIKDVLKQIAEKNICLHKIGKTRTKKVHIGKLNNFIFSKTGLLLDRLNKG
jgi:hypothetical protein